MLRKSSWLQPREGCEEFQDREGSSSRSPKRSWWPTMVAPYPHGIAIHNGIDRILLTSTVRASDLGDAREVISAVEASMGKVLGTYKVSKKPSPSRAAPVEILFVPGGQSTGRVCH